jgi:protein-disulfide isomerase
MDTTREVAAKPSFTRRQLLIGAAAVVVVAGAAGIGYYAWNRPAPTAPGEFSVAELMTPGPLGDEALGTADAPVTIIEYASMTCPHCANFHEVVYPDLKKKYIDTGKVRFIFREYPLDPLAAGASALARCAGKEKFFPLIEALFAQQRDWVVRQPEEPMFAIVKQAGFTRQSFEQCLENRRVLQGIEETRSRAAMRFNVNSTPTFFINGKILRGGATIEDFDKAIAGYLKG